MDFPILYIPLVITECYLLQQFRYINLQPFIKKHKEIKKVEHFNATPVGYKYQISFTIYVDGNLSTFESHEIANRLEKEIDKLDEIYLAVIHVNPIEIEKGENTYEK